MKIRLEGTPEELREKSSLLLERLSKALRPHVPEVAEALVKALPSKEPTELRHKALAETTRKMQDRYQVCVDMMLAEIFQKLDEVAEAKPMQKSEDVDNIVLFGEKIS